MTRINVIPPRKLSDKHLIAEYRELPRIFGLIRAAQDRGESINDKRNPAQYVLGSGHVRFFYDKAGWLQCRQQELVNECLHRKFNITYTDTSKLLNGIRHRRRKNWEPSEADEALNIERINQRGGLRPYV